METLGTVGARFLTSALSTPDSNRRQSRDTAVAKGWHLRNELPPALQGAEDNGSTIHAGLL